MVCIAEYSIFVPHPSAAILITKFYKMRNKLSTLFTFVCFLFSLSWLSAQTIRDIEIDPAQPVAGQAFTVKLKGDFPNACYSLSYQGATVSAGNNLNLYFNVIQSAGPCAQVTTPFTFTRTFQGLNYPGNYCLKFYGGLNVNTTDSQCFQVQAASAQGTICDINIPTISCGSNISANNNLEPNRLTLYNCSGYESDLYSGEKVYRLEVSEYSEVRLDMKILDNWIDLDMFLIRDVCDPKKPYYKVDKKDCITQAWIPQDNHKERKIVAKLEAGTYLVVIDGETNYDRGRFTLNVECGFQDLCGKALTVKCGEKLQNQSTIGGRNDVWRYTCGSGVFDSEGNDRVYKIKLDKASKLFVEMNILTPGQDMNLTLVKGEICSDVNQTINTVEAPFCLGRSPESGTGSNRRTILQDLPAGTYYVVVDARMAMTQGNYHISFNCDPVPCNLSVVPNVLDFTGNGAPKTLTIKASKAWSSEPTVSWVELSPRTGTGNGSTKVSVIRKDDPGSRQEILTFTCGSETQTVLLTQGGACSKPNANFTVSKNGSRVIVTAQAQDSATYTWDFGSGLVTSAAVDTVNLPNGPQRICLTVTSPCGTATTCQLVKVFGFTSAEIATIEQPKQLLQPRLYPNPSRGETFLEFESTQTGQALIQVFDLSGREVSKSLSVQMVPGINQNKLSVDHLQKGVYLVRVKLPELSWTEKLLVE